ncbi:MAG: proteinral L-amino acid transport system permease protein [Rhodocyclaceae bacterium]|nr:MAG: proteinral L-amino acid transport system permease protein [Rhodocyclaceae bacterium]TND02341.1 MAG: proteinral L-amino acid transport system permease protein [Rhodocyclaceae bacterium]
MQGRRQRELGIQALLAAALLAVLWWLLDVTAANMAERGIRSGFDFLTEPAGFAIGESLLPFDSADSTLLALAAGLANTLRVALPAILISTLLGTLIGLGRLSTNLLLRGLCTAYVETLRNVPLLLQLLAWYFVVTDLLPLASEALQLTPHVFLSKSGLSLPWFGGDGSLIDLPLRGDMGIVGGAALTPEFLALLLGLSLYTAAYVAETVRAGIQSVPRGQSDAALALGLTRAQLFRLVLLPQALRSIIPPLTNQHLSLTKNASLAVAIGYPDLVSVANTTLNQTGRAAECIALIMAVYLILSLLTAWLSAWLERRSGRWAERS